jgi:hypothetical protein
MAQDYNSSRSNRPRTEIRGDDSDGDSRILQEAVSMALLANPSGRIVSAGPVSIHTGTDNPLHEEQAQSGSNPLFEGQSNPGDGDNSDENEFMAEVWQYEMQPRSYCVSLSTMQISTNSQKAMRSGAQNHNSSRSNRTGAVTSPDLDGGGSNVASDSTMASMVYDPTNLRPDTDQNGFPEIMKSASFSISKRSARTGRSQSPIYEGDTNAGSSAIYRSEDALAAGGGDLDGDGYGDMAADGFHFELEIMAPDLRSATADTYSAERGRNPNAPPGSQVAPSQTKVIVMGMTDNSGDPPLDESAEADAELDLDSDEDGIPDFQDPDSDGDGLLDGLEDATYSISDGTGLDIIDVIASRGGDGSSGTRSGGDENPLAVDEMGWVESPVDEVRPPDNVYQWSYQLSALTEGEEIPGGGTLTVIYTGGAWHFSVQLDPDDDGDGYGRILQDSSFSISKRSARTGR